MLEFYRENLRYSSKILWFRLLAYSFVAIPFSVIITAGLFLLFKINRDIFNIAVLSVLTLPVFLFLIVAGLFLWNFIYITGYSFFKKQEETLKISQIIYKIYGKIIRPKVLIVLFAASLLFITLGSVIYFYILPESIASHIGIKVSLTLLIYALLGFLIVITPHVLRIVIKLFHIIPGILLKIFIGLAVLLSQVLVLAGIYFIVSWGLFRWFGIPM